MREVPSDRFSLDIQDRFRFYGRLQFREIYTAAKSLAYRGCRMYYLHGTLGSGKSHILAALTCLLLKEGHRVVYLPDCRALLRHVFGYLQCALVLAYHRDSDTAARHYLERCKTIEQLATFCDKASTDHRLLFIIDQANALEPEDEALDRFTLEAKRDARTLLDKIVSCHLKLSSATANYLHGMADEIKQTGERRLQMYGGLTDEEMRYWWRNSGLGTQLNNEHRQKIEDSTGRLPILLNVIDKQATDLGEAREGDDIIEQLLGGLLESQEARSMQKAIHKFGECQIERYKDTVSIARFREAWHTCIIGGAVNINMEHYLDWRHFYIRNRKGAVTCGIVRRVAADFLRSLGNPEDFLGPHWSRSLALAGSNMSMLGFCVEQMVLSWMALRGCGFIEPRFGDRPNTILVDTGSGILEDISLGQPGVVLYIPKRYNFPAVDAVLVSTAPGEAAAVYGIQVTISKTHSNSEELFFRNWETWLTNLDLPRAKITFGFVWILEDRGLCPAFEIVREKVITLRGQGKIICPDFRRLRITVQEVDRDIGSKLSVA